MSLNLLIDECLSPLLVQQARDGGHAQSTCVRDHGCVTPWEVVPPVKVHEFTMFHHLCDGDEQGQVPSIAARFEKGDRRQLWP